LATKKTRQRNRTAQRAGQTANIDLCFVPVEHAAQVKLPAVSGSSGRLVVERMPSERQAADWPGARLAQSELGYEAAMQEYLAATQERHRHGKGEQTVKTGRKSVKQAYRRAIQGLQEERYQVRQRRKQEDVDWQILRQQYRNQPTNGSPSGPWTGWETRRRLVEARQQEDALWRTQYQQLRQQAHVVSQVSAWLAILVVIDNCTRQCFGLPLFVAGAQVTAQQVVEALEVLLPVELRYLISDQGSHFRTLAFAQLAQRKGFFWVPIARHRPQSNGIAERFVRTLKTHLAYKAWQSSQELAHLLADFVSDYNDRPHQGLPIRGLSPNEFARRIRPL